jgi:hypothetical protein
LADHQTSRNAAPTASADGTFEHGQVLPGEAGLRAVLVDRRRAHGERPAERPHQLADRFDGRGVARGHGVDHRAGERDTGREREARPRGFPEPHGLRAVQRDVVRLGERDNAAHPSTST